MTRLTAESENSVQVIAVAEILVVLSAETVPHLSENRYKGFAAK